jgi:hypothetical protein
MLREDSPETGPTNAARRGCMRDTSAVKSTA